MVEEGTPIIKITNIKEDGSLDLMNTAKYNKPITPKLQKFILKDKDVVVCMTGATIGKVARVLKTDQKYIVNQRVCIIRAKDSRLQDFVYHTLTLPTFRKYVEVVGYGAAQPNISAASIGKYRIQSGNELPTQQKIASILSTYDTLIENNTKRICLLEQMAENLYKEWFVRFRFPGHENVEMDNGLPKGWKREKLDEIIELYDSKRKPLSSMQRADMEKIYPYYGAAELMDYVDDYIFNGKYLLMGEDGSVITPDGYPMLQLVTGKFWVNNHAHVIQGKQGISVEFLYLMFKKMNISGVVTGSAQPKISKGRLIGKYVTLPNEQIIKKYEQIILPMFSEINDLQHKNTLLTRQRDLLLPRLMSGKLEVMVR